ncbi:MAG: YIP1 family protein [Clostridia bacterium]|nr:YIP1 family protein [Clostridia bacterium]
MKKSIFRILTVLLGVLSLISPLTASAYYSYDTYTYSIDGWYMNSPDAYVPSEIVDSDSIGLSVDIDNPKDITVDSDKNVYIADATNNRIVVLNNRFKRRFEIANFTNQHGIKDSLANPSGVFVTDSKIYVADTDNSRIVVFDKEGKFLETIGKPVSQEISVDDLYRPIALSVDSAGRMYIVSSTTYRGIIAINKEGQFQGFIGAQKATLSAWEIFWRNFQTEEQRQYSESVVSTEYNNITIDDMGLIYVTTSSIDESSQQNAIQTKDKSGDYAPVKKLNIAGDEILDRNGFWPPSGEVSVTNENMTTNANAITGPSKIIDVALGPEGTWSIIDEKRNKVFTYDEEGRLLFVFGDTGTQLGNMQSIQAIAYMGDDMLLLDKTADNITVMKRTEYGDTLINAINNQRERRYDEAEADWKEILKRNNNFDAAYVGIGRAYYRDGKYEDAMDMYKYAYDTENYSTAFKYYRQEWVAKYALVVPIVVVVIAVGLYLFFRYAGKKNKAVATRPDGTRTFWEEILYGVHVMMHPFDGFWDLKHERRGSVRGAVVYIVLAVAAFSYNAIGTAYLFNPKGDYTSVFGQIISILVPLFLWCIANWCLTTLFEGEGSFKDIFIASSYALAPIPMLMIPATLLTNIFTLNEQQVITLLTTIMWIWVFALIFFGSMVTHDYSLGKNFIITISTIVGMAAIMFIALLFSSLLQKIASFITSIVVEVSYRM